MHISHLHADILQYGDDMNAAFHWVLYHPDIEVVFASIFMEFLVIPVGSIFGSKFGPSWWCIIGELQVHLVACQLKPTRDVLPLVTSVCLVAPPSLQEAAQLVLAIADAVHSGLDSATSDRLAHAYFVNDTQTAAFHPCTGPNCRSPSPRKVECGGQCPVLSLPVPLVGLCYCCMLPVAGIAGLPSVAWSALDAAFSCFIR